jgi:hypothetical protein
MILSIQLFIQMEIGRGFDALQTESDYSPLFLALVIGMILPIPSRMNISVPSFTASDVGYAAVHFPGFILENVSLGLNCAESLFCTQREGYMSFTANRQWHSGNYSILCVLALFYPPKELSRRFRILCGLLQRLASQFPLSPGPVVFLILAIDVNVLSLVHAHSAFIEMPCVSSADVCSTFLDLDYGARVFQAQFSSSASDYRVFAYWVTLPYRLRLFDYFDFFSKLDLDPRFSVWMQNPA